MIIKEIVVEAAVAAIVVAGRVMMEVAVIPVVKTRRNNVGMDFLPTFSDAELISFTNEKNESQLKKTFRAAKNIVPIRSRFFRRINDPSIDKYSQVITGLTHRQVLPCHKSRYPRYHRYD